MTGNPRVLISLFLLTAYVFVVPVAGFFVTTGAYLAAHIAFLGIRPAWLVLAVVAGALIFLYLVFIQFLGVPIPHGALY
jgi:hypothetical protein